MRLRLVNKNICATKKSCEFRSSVFRSPREGIRGFTVIELMVTLALAAIVLSLAVPSFQEFIRKSRATAEFNRLLGDIAYARSEAVKRAAPIALCPSSNGSACAGEDWEAGWIIFIDDGEGAGGAAGDKIINGDEEVLRVAQASKSGITITTNDFPSPPTGILFSAKGTMANTGQFVLCDPKGASEAKGITFSAFGQFRPMRDTDENGIIDDGAADPNDVSCS